MSMNSSRATGPSAIIEDKVSGVIRFIPRFRTCIKSLPSWATLVLGPHKLNAPPTTLPDVQRVRSSAANCKVL